MYCQWLGPFSNVVGSCELEVTREYSFDIASDYHYSHGLEETLSWS